MVTDTGYICEGKTEDDYIFRLSFPFSHPSTITFTVIDPRGEVVTSAIHTANAVRDRRSSGLITKPGFSMRYSYSDGKLHDVVIIALNGHWSGGGYVNTATIAECSEIAE